MKKTDDFTELDFHDIRPGHGLSRRDFLKLAGGGVVILFTVGDPLLEAQRRGQPLPEDFNAFLRIGADGRVSCFTGKIEMGQGVITSLAMMLADELEVPLDDVDMVMGDTDLCPWDMGTFGSMTTRFFGPPLRTAAAEARAVLVELASEHFGVPAAGLEVKDGAVRIKAEPGKSVTYAELTKGRAIARHLKGKPVEEAPAQFTVVGKPVLRRDAVAKVTGAAEYAADSRAPGLLYARLLRPPAHGAKLISADTSAARSVPGAVVVEEGDLIAALHEDPEQAEFALKQIKAEFGPSGSTLDETTIFDHLLKVAPAPEVASQGGDLASGEKTSKTVIEKTYLDGYKAHAPIEPHAAMAMPEGDRIIIRASTQSPFPLKSQAASALWVAEDKVRVMPTFVGGGFGGKTNNQQGVEAARLAKLTGRPVMVAWTRAEEFFYDTFRPAAIVKIKAGVDGSGRISLWDYGVYYAGDRGAEPFYDIPNHRTSVYSSGWRGVPGSHPFATGAWRAPGNNTNTFAREVHIDLLAEAARADPLEFRLRNLKDERMIRVLKTLADKSGWTPAKAPSRRGRGLACGTDAGTYVAHMAEVEVDRKTGHVQVKRVVCVQDMGLSINPEGAAIQVEGCITMGLGYALAEDIHFKNGRLLDLNFDTYMLPRFSWLPDIETHILDRRDAAPQGGGEPAIICMGAVVANAIFDAVGVRLFQLPLSPARVKQALG
jgi:nicotinate dehydrogenase subunit B